MKICPQCKSKTGQFIVEDGSILFICYECGFKTSKIDYENKGCA